LIDDDFETYFIEYKKRLINLESEKEKEKEDDANC